LVSTSKKIKEINGLVTTHRILLFKETRCVQIPLCFIKEMKKTGGTFKKDGISLAIDNRKVNPIYEVDYYTNVLKRADLPPILDLPSSLKLRFHDKTRDSFVELT
jgi:hypothetical protein